MKSFIELQEIESMCGSSKCSRGYKGEHQDGCSAESNKQNESEHKFSKWFVFKKKCKAFWGEVKNVLVGLSDVLGTATIFLKAYYGIKKAVMKMKVVAV